MLHVFICKDDQEQRERLEEVINNYIFIEELAMKVILSTGNPQNILDYLEAHPETVGLYFLDIELQHEMTGIMLGRKIRERDFSGKIVFITIHGELMYLTFFYQLEAMDYIVKGQDFEDIKRRVLSCIQTAYRRCLTERKSLERFFKVKIGSTTKMLSFDEIMFFTTSNKPHKLTLHLRNSQLGFVSSMKEIEDYSHEFVRIHTSYIVNANNIDTIDRHKRELVMKNGEKCLISVRGLKELDKRTIRLKS